MSLLSDMTSQCYLATSNNASNGYTLLGTTLRLSWILAPNAKFQNRLMAFYMNNILFFQNSKCTYSSCMTYHQVCNKSNMTGVTCGAGTAYPSRAHSRILVEFVLLDLQFSVQCFAHLSYYLSFCSFYFGHCIASLSIYNF